MRFGTIWVGALCALAGAGMTVSVGCGGSGGSGGTGGGGGSGGTGGAAGCGADAVCTGAEDATLGGGVVVPECLGFADNAGDTVFGLRIAQLTITKPAALASGLIAGIVGGGVTLDNVACNLTGQGTFNWLIEVDTATGDVTTGGAKPVDLTSGGYTFVDEMIGGTQVSPTVLSGAFSGGVINATTGGDVVVPIFLDDAGTSAVLLPLKAARLMNATVSADQSCIGSYNADTLSPANNCLPDTGETLFTDAGSLDGFITLEDSDAVIVESLNASLCTLLTGLNDMGSPTKKCPRDAADPTKFTAEVIAKADWCSTTNMAAGGGCQDAFQLGATFAAQSVTIN